MDSKCPICKIPTRLQIRLPEVKSVYSAGKFFDIVECANCSVYFNTPPVTELELSDFYSSNYGYSSHHLVHKEKISRARKLKRLSGLNWVDATVGEIGSGGGEFAQVIADEISRLEGCEIDEVSAKNVNLPNVNIHIGQAGEFLDKLQSNSFDIFVLSHSLEHMQNPGNILKSIYRNLKSDGSLLVVVPNRLAAPRIFRRFWGYWQVPIHVCHFDITSLTKLLESEKFYVQVVKYRRSDFMAVGSFIANLLGLKSNQDVPNNIAVNSLVKIFSQIYGVSYRFGKQDLIVVAKKKNA